MAQSIDLAIYGILANGKSWLLKPNISAIIIGRGVTSMKVFEGVYYKFQIGHRLQIAIFLQFPTA